MPSLASLSEQGLVLLAAAGFAVLYLYVRVLERIAPPS